MALGRRAGQDPAPLEAVRHRRVEEHLARRELAEERLSDPARFEPRIGWLGRRRAQQWLRRIEVRFVEHPFEATTLYPHRRGIVIGVSPEALWRAGFRGPLGDAPTDVVQRRAAARRPGNYPAIGTAEIETIDGRQRIPITGRVEDISTDGLLLRATADDNLPALPYGIERTLLHITMPWGEMTATITTVDQRADLLRGTFEWIDPSGATELARFCLGR